MNGMVSGWRISVVGRINDRCGFGISHVSVRASSVPLKMECKYRIHFKKSEYTVPYDFCLSPVNFVEI
jgi:hypothetical protein